ncbi:bifunctional 5,10-methylene-tetrahydrofolate dehydrogenase/5,10-methylene-tetrahydrofolate cyclohydrolase [Cryomorpha ignava]|uniref:Bifunctional protein FolD n=1 Tax=Cryomorpha ignava TaxID=101383 RepID=A0A7K3WNS8_9FLAO|nr:tetrahydrofolate dehydrogenase/cyclohydrolase catalytic domain-containing protein [Cryomorpha ignava]NEN23178.1 bifunctional 5,10-methylene-tetrahydrofolate dehydrogenase/5,10-methylene-tetrahydrofolate cyclohydrolase [Cryomorpha ignava]
MEAKTNDTLVLNGKATAQEIRNEIAKKVADRKQKGLKVPHLAAVLVGTDGGSETYVSYKVKDCKEVGYESTLIRKPDTISEKELLDLVADLNANKDIDGFIVQLPLPKHIDPQKIIMAIDPLKDVDGFHPENVGKMTLGLSGFLPATPSGIIELMRRNSINPSGKHCVVLGRSNIVGSPMSILLSRNVEMGNATVTLCHSRTKNLKELAATADILIAALGKPGFVTADMVKPEAVVIDVGTTRVPDSSKKSGFSLKGDVCYGEVFQKVSAITPVPGGVGPMTRVALLLNTLKAVELR